MKYNNRNDVEAIGKAGVYHYIDDDGDAVSRQLASYWICSKDVDKGISEHFKYDGFWEAWITLWISRNVKPGSVCIDVGANYGYYTFQLAQHGCMVVAIEANPDLIPRITKSIELNGCSDRVKLINAAATNNSKGTVTLNLKESSLNSTIKASSEEHGNVKVKAVALNKYASYKGGIDFVKMDIEGAEELAWGGMQELFDVNKNCIVMMEFVAPHYVDNGRLFFDELLAKCVVSYVDYDGGEKEIQNHDFFNTDSEDLRMLILRKRDK